MNDNKSYLGDGLYVEFDGYQFRLFTERGLGNVHEVFLEPEVMQAFLKFVEKNTPSKEKCD